MQDLLIFAALMAAVVLAAAAVVLARTFALGKARPRAGEEKPAGAGDPDMRAARSLSDMIKIETLTGQTARNGGQFLSLHDYLKSRYPNVHGTMQRRTAAEYSLIYRWKGSGEGAPLLLCAHMDVVPAEGEWERSPFSGDIDQGYVFGRGAVDCKNMLTAIMEAAEALCAEGRGPDRDIYLAFGHDEEINGVEGARAIAQYFKDENINFGIVLDEGEFISKGALGINELIAPVAVTEKGFLTVKYTAYDAGGHASKPPRHSALGRVSEAVCRMEYARRRAKVGPIVAEYLRKLAPYLPFSKRAMVANRWLFSGRLLSWMSKDPVQNALVRTTTAPTMARAGRAPNVLPPSAAAVLNYRPAHHDSCDKVLEYTKDLLRGLDIEADVLIRRDASSISSHLDAEYKIVEETISKVYAGAVTVPYIMCGGTDSRQYEPMCKNVFRFSPFVVMPDDAAKMHGANERIKIESLNMGVEFIKALILRVAWADKKDEGQIL